jgi:hypothetical protein
MQSVKPVVIGRAVPVFRMVRRHDGIHDVFGGNS